MCPEGVRLLDIFFFAGGCEASRRQGLFYPVDSILEATPRDLSTGTISLLPEYLADPQQILHGGNTYTCT